MNLALLNLPDGITRPYRPKPKDFRDVYIRIGWDGIEDHFNTNWRVIRRWIELEGRDGLIAARRDYVAQQQLARRMQRKRYVLGRTLSAVKPRTRSE